MNDASMKPCDPSGAALIEGTARVVGIDGGVVWLEPEPGSSCGGCAGAAACGAGGIGTHANRLATRRFALADDAALTLGHRLDLGERVVVGIRDDALVRGALTAYALPLITLLGAGVTAQAITGSDAMALAASIAGLALGIVAAGALASRLSASGRCAPRLLRRADAPAPTVSQGVTP